MNFLQILFLDIFKKTALCVRVYGKYINAEISPKSLYILVNNTKLVMLTVKDLGLCTRLTRKNLQ